MTSFTPSSEQNRRNPENFVAVYPKTGPRRARVSLIVDLGTQEREDIYKLDGKIVKEGTPGAEAHAQKPAQQVAVYADLVNDVVDYGGTIGKAQYRFCLNKSFKGDIQGINFYKSPVMDVNGKDTGKPWRIHNSNILSKLAEACEEYTVPESADIGKLLDKQFMLDVAIKETDSGKKDNDGNPIIYKNVNLKTVSKTTPAIDEDGNETIPVFAALKQEPLCITFANAKKEDIKFLRRDVIAKIKLATNYAGSEMQAAIEAFEAEGKVDAADSEEEATKVAKAADKAPAKKAPPKQTVVQDIDDDIPFMYGCRLGKEDQFRGPYATWL